MIPYKSPFVADFFKNFQKNSSNPISRFLSIFNETLCFDELIPTSFSTHFYAKTGRPRKYSLPSMLKALLLQRFFSIPTTSLLLTVLNCSQELRTFCGFDTLPDVSAFTRFKQHFLMDLQDFFHHLVDRTEPICQQIDASKASMLLFDTSGIEAWVTENNPKYANRIIKRLKQFQKNLELQHFYNPYQKAYTSMPTHAASNPAIQQMYINGHFCYAYKFGILTNGLGIVRSLSFYNQAFLRSHPTIIVHKKSNSPEEEKSLADAKALIPSLKDFFFLHPSMHPTVFLGDAAFDSIQIYQYLLQEATFEKAYIPLKNKLSLTSIDYLVNEFGIPCCPNDASLPMKREGSKSHLRCGLPTMKFVCPKMKWHWDNVAKQSRRICHCDTPCTSSSCGRMIYVYPEQNLLAYPGTIRGTQEWKNTYKIRVQVEKTIHQFKDSFCIAKCRTQNETTLHADLFLAGITQLITVLVADKLHQPQAIRSLKSWIT